MNTAPSPAAPAERVPAYAWYVVAVLLAASVSSWVDRQVMTMMVDLIKADFSLSDTQVSLVLGSAFAIFYSLLGFPIGRLADTRSRRAIIGWGVAAWSAMTVFTGLARSYAQLFVARIGVGVGEATLSPTAYSLLADYFPPRRLAFALSIFGMGIFMGAGLGYLISGTVVEAVQHAGPQHLPIVGVVRPWQTVFLVVGAPGVALALLMLTVREPPRGSSGTTGSAAVRDVVRYIREHAGAYTAHGIGTALFSFVNLATAFWFPAFFMRAHGWTPAQVGYYMGGSTLVFGTLGVIAGGRVAQWLDRKGVPGGNLGVGSLAAAGSLLVALPLYASRSFPVVLTALVITNVFAAMPWGAFAAAVQEMTPPPMRGQASALYLFLINSVGGALGPVVVGLLNDRLFHDGARVGLSLLIVTVVARLGSILALRAGVRPYRRATAAARVL